MALVTLVPEAMAQNTASLPVVPTVKSSDTLEMRDAPLRAALELFFNANRVDFSIDNTVVGRDITLSYANKPMEEGFLDILRASPTPLSYTALNRVYLIRFDQSSNKPATPETPSLRYAKIKKAIPNDYRNERDVPRRISAILRHDVRGANADTPVTTWSAILETTDLSAGYYDTLIEIVQIHARIPSRIKDAPLMRVVDINAKGITLQPDGGKPFNVPLAPLRKP